MTLCDPPGVQFEQQRLRLFGLAYRMLGSATDAEDVVQDAFLRLHGADRDTIRELPAWLTKVVTNLCLNRLSAAVRQREQYVGTWLPEPILTEAGALGPLQTVEQRDSVSFALLVLLERLNPSERAVFVLREAFEYSYRDIAQIMDHSEANCRQLHRRAKAHVEQGRSRFEPDQKRQFDLLRLFLAAAQDGDLAALEQCLAEDVVSCSDGGGKATAGRRPVLGRVKVARLVVGMFAKVATGIEIRVAEINGAAAVVGLMESTVLGVWVLQAHEDRVTALRAVSNPDKLAFLGRQLSHSEPLAGLFQ